MDQKADNLLAVAYHHQPGGAQQEKNTIPLNL